MKSVMPAQHDFSRVPTADIPRSSFDRSHGHKTTFDSGYLIPVFWDLALPGDTFNLEMNAFARMSTPLWAPMDNMFLESFFFSVPWRLIWTNFPKFMGEQANPGDSTSYTIPQMTGPAGAGILSNSLSDYFGLPVGKASVVFNSFLHRAYNLIWNTWFRDQNLQSSAVVDLGDGPDTYTNYVLLRRGKRHDYFTSALPWPQKGTAVSIPLGTSATVKTQSTNLLSGAGVAVQWLDSSGAAPNASALTTTGAGGNANKLYASTTAGTVNGNPLYPANMYADLSNATAATINSLRSAFQLQKFYERDARGGTRYIEIVWAHFNVQSPDLRATRPTYLGGGSSPVNINPVAQTAPKAATGTTTPQGTISAFATASAMGHGFTHSFTEHCIVLGLISVRADLTYQQGLDRMLSYRTRADLYWPAFAGLGEQSILNQEIYCNMDANDALVFGYQERYAEYRYKPSKITGLFRSNVTAGFTTLDAWHLSQNFGSLPTLNATFIQDTPPVNRIVVTSTEPQFLFDSYFKYKCARPMPIYGIPGNIDRF